MLQAKQIPVFFHILLLSVLQNNSQNHPESSVFFQLWGHALGGQTLLVTRIIPTILKGLYMQKTVEERNGFFEGGHQETLL